MNSQIITKGEIDAYINITMPMTTYRNHKILKGHRNINIRIIAINSHSFPITFPSQSQTKISHEHNVSNILARVPSSPSPSSLSSPSSLLPPQQDPRRIRPSLACTETIANSSCRGHASAIDGCRIQRARPAKYMAWEGHELSGQNDLQGEANV